MIGDGKGFNLKRSWYNGVAPPKPLWLGMIGDRTNRGGLHIPRSCKLFVKDFSV